MDKNKGKGRNTRKGILILTLAFSSMAESMGSGRKQMKMEIAQ